MSFWNGKLNYQLMESWRLINPFYTDKEISDRVSCTEVMYFNSFTCHIKNILSALLQCKNLKHSEGGHHSLSEKGTDLQTVYLLSWKLHTNIIHTWEKRQTGSITNLCNSNLVHTMHAIESTLIKIHKLLWVLNCRTFFPFLSFFFPLCRILKTRVT